jgi:hypothetical protein
MEKSDTTKEGHVIFEPVKSPRHLIELARQEKKEFLHIPLFIVLFTITVFSFRQTVSVIQAAGESRGKTSAIEKKRSQYTSEFDLNSCKMKEGEEVKFDSNNPDNTVKCESGIDNACSICGKTEEEFALEEKANQEHQLRVKREEARTKQVAALARRRAAAPVPVAGIKVNGKWICDKKNDKPTVSKVNNRGKMHWDRECCLDPDEWPNPWCTY